MLLEFRESPRRWMLPNGLSTGSRTTSSSSSSNSSSSSSSSSSSVDGGVDGGGGGCSNSVSSGSCMPFKISTQRRPSFDALSNSKSAFTFNSRASGNTTSDRRRTMRHPGRATGKSDIITLQAKTVLEDFSTPMKTVTAH
ncbi:hypothetical protein HZH68_015720 [Vespula germanica]|uniref:Uncharacterized protein n=1 Tax=Vespula germanica TaxID=30212 RepID=A0A834J5H6_VESGE|nr:hypothetical protein HZH68_015720 [Vespula germanica]